MFKKFMKAISKSFSRMFALKMDSEWDLSEFEDWQSQRCERKACRHNFALDPREQIKVEAAKYHVRHWL